MPLYEYQCKQCGHRFEKIQSFSAPDEKECPKCGAEVERLISAPAIQFKGAGWYVNDYAPKAASGSTDSKPADSGAASNTGSGSESKPAAAETSAKPAASESTSSSSSSESSSKSPTTSTT